MPRDDSVFVSGSGITIGEHGEHDYLYSSGEPVDDSGFETYVYETGVGIGAIAPINLEELKSSEELLTTGETVTLTTYVLNTTTSPVSDYIVEFMEGDNIISTQTANIPGGTKVTFSHDVVKSSVGQFQYQATGTFERRKKEYTNTVLVSWMNISPGRLSSSEGGLALHQGQTQTTLSIPVSNPTSENITVKVELLEDGIEFYQNTVEIAAGSSETYSTNKSYNSVQEHKYQARVTEVGTGVSGLSNQVEVRWYNEETAWDNIIVPVTVANTTDEGASSPNETTFARGIEQTQDGYLEETEGGDGVISVLWEDGGSLPRDEKIIWYNGQWEDGGYVTVEVWHSSARYEHEGWVGENKSYYYGSHQSNEGSNTDYNELVFRGRAYSDGTLTDDSGNEIGVWR